jgi:hypothetical protein
VRRLAGPAALALVLPLAACAAVPTDAGVDLVRAGCPVDIRIHTDDLPRVEWGFLYALLDADAIEVGDDEVSAPLVVDGEPTGASLTILLGDPLDGVSVNTLLQDDPGILLGAVDTDVALLDAKRAPTVGVFAPLARDPRLLFWHAATYPNLRDIETFAATATPDGEALMPVAAVPGDPFTSYAIGMGWITPEQIEAGTDVDVELTVAAFLESGGLRAQAGDALVVPHLLLEQPDVPPAARWQVIDSLGYTRDAGVLSAEPHTLVKSSDCLHALVPILQRSLVDYLEAPEQVNELLVELSAQVGDETYDADAVAAASAELLGQRFAGNSRDGTIGDIDMGRLRGLFENAIPQWRKAELPIPSGVSPDDIVTNVFIDKSIGL